MKVIKSDKSTCAKFVTNKHYSRKMSIYWDGFELIEDGKVTGIVIYGQPSPSIQRYSFENKDFRIYELARLVIQSENKNAGSFLISQSLKMLSSQPCAVISYADSEYNHCGIVYQATNWLYTGATISHDSLYLYNGKRLHAMTLRDMGITSPKKWAKENNIKTVKPKPKHRYFYFVGNKRQKREMKKKLKYKIIDEYPKCDQKRYNDGDFIELNR